MALRHCTECGGFLSTKSDACPHCGHNNRRGGVLRSLFVAAVILGALALGWKLYDDASFTHAFNGDDDVSFVDGVKELGHHLADEFGGSSK